MSTNVDTIVLSWKDIEKIIEQESRAIKDDGIPDLILAIQRGGFIPSVMLSHALNIRDIIPLNVKITVDDTVNSQKIQPILEHNPAVEKIKGKNVLIVDDIVGSGNTYQVVYDYLTTYCPASIKSLVCVINRDNWNKANDESPEKSITYIGKEVRGWVKFPWERIKWDPICKKSLQSQ